MEPKTTKSYSLKATTSLGERKKGVTQRALFDYFLPKLLYSDEILEIGPGRGEFAKECQVRNFAYVGVEPSQKLCFDLKASGISVINDNVPPIPCESGRFDLVHSNDVVEHFCTYHEVMRFFSESYRVLKPGGFISVIAPNFLTIKHLFFQYEYQHSYITTNDRLKNLLIDSGFEIIHSRCFFLWLSPGLNWIDRIIAHTIIPIVINPLVGSLIRVVISNDFLYRIHKNIFDHVAILAKKPL